MLNKLKSELLDMLSCSVLLQIRNYIYSNFAMWRSVELGNCREFNWKVMWGTILLLGFWWNESTNRCFVYFVYCWIFWLIDWISIWGLFLRNSWNVVYPPLSCFFLTNFVFPRSFSLLLFLFSLSEMSEFSNVFSYIYSLSEPAPASAPTLIISRSIH